MLVDSSPSIFENSYGVFLPSINNKLLFNVNSYKKNYYQYSFNRKNNLLNKKHEQEHIPAYYSLEYFFNLPHKNGKRIASLNQNATVIDIEIDWHKKGRTWGRRITKDKRILKNGNIYQIEPIFKVDKNSLKNATIKDFSIMAYIIRKNGSHQDYVDFLKSFPKL